MQTLKQTIENLHTSLKDYIEATYHISAPSLVAQRQSLLDRDGVIHRIPYLESTPKYHSGEKFESISGLPEAALELLELLSIPDGDLPKLIYNPPYKHQAESLKKCLIDGNNLVIMTGTGSGKTESFLLPILGKFAKEAKENPSCFAEQPAMRALIMYPMNALVNDQLGRLRGILGDPRLVKKFKAWCGRPPRFARYTSRTPYAGVRSPKKDTARLKSFDSFYVDVLRRTQSDNAEDKLKATQLLSALKKRGKWPAKPDLEEWFGQKGTEWINSLTGEFVRAITLPDDSELLTRHEVQTSPPDLLVTNYSMLEYMLMRPIERPIFDKTKNWLANNPDEKFLVVLDEAHLYRGAAGAEVGLLLRRLRDRIGISTERLQVICATASFDNAEYAADFGAQLSGTLPQSFVPVQGSLALKEKQDKGTLNDANALSSIDLKAFYGAETNEDRLKIISPILKYRKVPISGISEQALFIALEEFDPMGRLINVSMQEAVPIADLGELIFQKEVPKELADKAVTTLMALASVARSSPGVPGLLPCRVHNFFRGLPGLWVCMDPNCSEVPEKSQTGVCGKMYSQPIETCGCGSRVLELFTCRNCGTAYGRAYTDDIEEPNNLWSEPGEQIRMASGEIRLLEPIDLLLEDPLNEDAAEPADYDLETGQINPNTIGPRTRTVYIRQARLSDINDDDEENVTSPEPPGKFVPCAICGKQARFGRSYVQDHQTKGDQPFQALITRQIQIQPPGPQKATRFAPLRGRKVLAFSDSRQVAARLAPNIQMYSERDSLRPLIIRGFKWLLDQNSIQPYLNLDDLFLGILIASKELNVRLRPELHAHENFDAEEIVEKAVNSGEYKNPNQLIKILFSLRSKKPPEALLGSILTNLSDKFYGMESLALANLKENDENKSIILALPNISQIAESEEAKLSLARFWIRCWTGFGLTHTPGTWIDRKANEGYRIRSRNPNTKFDQINAILPEKEARKFFWDHWHPKLLTKFTTSKEGGNRYLNGSELSLQFDGEWVYCAKCRSVHRPIQFYQNCIECGHENVSLLSPCTDPVFIARKGFYRKPVIEALEDPPREPMAVIAAEHTAQLNAPQDEDVFSKAEEHELLFQDIELNSTHANSRSTAIDILSSTTTMEVGIDLGELSGVALRNMPPGRANYQQRAGRAGRRGNAVATVLAFGSADSHDEHYFSFPDEMIRGKVVDPKLTLNNPEITRRHIRAFLLQNYHQDRLSEIDPNQPHDLFSVLGSVSAFRQSNSALNYYDFTNWLNENETKLRNRIEKWLPNELSIEDKDILLGEFVKDCTEAIEEAISLDIVSEGNEEENDDGDEEAPEVGEERPQQASQPSNLLDRLLYCGKLPRYAFPTDVATFSVFDRDRSTPYRHIMKFSPSQGLPIALSQYSPGRQVWISGKCYTSGAIYSIIKENLHKAWETRKVYMECSECGYAKTFDRHEVSKGDVEDCPACSESNGFGPAKYWVRPPGFAHPIYEEEVTSPDEIPETSYATRAKLTMGTPGDSAGWHQANDRIRGLSTREHLLVSNTGPQEEGYTYCVKCGRIEASSSPIPSLGGPHQKPFPEKDDNAICEGIGPTRHIVLGTDFITDIGLFSLRVEKPIEIHPTHFSSQVALRTISEALAKSACKILEIEPSELMAEFRPALTIRGKSGKEVEIFLYDTLPGGAGFASQLVGKELELFQNALLILKNCPEACDTSCYRCLRTFKNKLEHRLLDRHVGVELLEYLISGKPPVFNAKRIKASTNLLLNDLKRRSEGNISFSENASVTYGSGNTIEVPVLAKVGSNQFIIALSGALTSGHPADPEISILRDNSSKYHVIVENELEVRANLPSVSLRVLQQIKDYGI
ncbi:MAG: DEAD/DEAH box helicase [Emcibacteraceae bacterium]